MWWVEGVFLGFNSFLKLIIIFVNFFVRKSFFFFLVALNDHLILNLIKNISYLGASAQTTRTVKSESPSPIDLSVDQPDAAQLHQLRLSPRLEMRLALNHDIMGDEDLINYEGPSLTSILGRDLSSYHRITGKDIIMNRIMNRKDVINNTHCSNKHLEEQEGNKSDLKFSSQQNNSKMDTPILNRKANQLTWNNSGFARKGTIYKSMILR